MQEDLTLNTLRPTGNQLLPGQSMFSRVCETRLPPRATNSNSPTLCIIWLVRESFRKRHPNLTLSVATSLSKARMLAFNIKVLDHYFDLLEETLRENCLMDKPYQILNMDETGMPLDAKPVKTIMLSVHKILILCQVAARTKLLLWGV